MELSFTEKLLYTTVRIETDTGTGTGFFMKLLEKSDTYVPVIVTNKHVIAGASIGKLTFSLITENGVVQDDEHYSYTIIEFESSWIKHPDPNVDLCILPISEILSDSDRKSIKLFYEEIPSAFIASKEYINDLNAIEDITMIGYPNGIWDSKNNKPIVRKGITATHPKLDYNGKEEFMIDAACFPGSSGSPVFLFNSTSYQDKNGNTTLGGRCKLLGILYAGPQHTVTGDIQIVNVPIKQETISIARIPNNLGVVIKAYKILEFEDILKEIIEKENF